MSTDSEIIERSIDDPGTFSEIFERHVRPVGGYIRRRIGSDAVDDVLSETFLVAFRRRAAFDRSWASARPWLLGIATRVVKNHRAAEARQWRAFEASSSADVVAEPPQTASEARMDADAALRALAPRIAALAARDRDTLLLHAWGDLTYEQIADALGVPVGTVRSRLNRVRRQLAPPGSRGATRLTWMKKEESDAAYGTGS
ncbi:MULTISPECIES: RNA polymerase sigma factor [unclassified Microbacterium]|uniref:RNA polymerase sigma factor n=1 Tax=unclassified Microbacterium TaxID=2609290 RepID=UPI001604B5C1|nr:MULTISPECIES: RNA polymerase sigma factor [unclassified Microbacterium]QNA92911.1 RNA polymerase sigma factor [Microbacterium sp. Se63.02b]QYM63069.1 RNA polymerase sigma factor [Microbacterium sp. Se5.02b]